MENYIIIAVLVVILGSAIGYVIKAKKRGEKCIGCPHSKICNSGNCNCKWKNLETFNVSRFLFYNDIFPSAILIKSSEKRLFDQANQGLVKSVASCL